MQHRRFKRLNMMHKPNIAHKPIICRRCGLEIVDKGDKRHVPECKCAMNLISVFSSTQQPPDLDFYDKHSK
jgi:hypothetical protein